MSILDSDFFEIAVAWFVSIVIFASLIIYISKHPQKRTMPLKIIFIAMFLGGTALYCTCYYRAIEEAKIESSKGSTEKKFPYLEWVNDKDGNASWFYIPYVVVKSVIDVGIMFYGRDNSSIFYALPESKRPLPVFLFWLIHLIAFYTAASALLIRFGNDLLRGIRIMTSKISDIDLVFGINPDSLAFGRNIAETKGKMLVYVDGVVKEDYETTIRDLGGISYSDIEAVKATPTFLKTIRIKPQKTKLKLYAMSDEYDKNLHYARMMSESLQKANISPEQTELLLLGTDEWKGMLFQSSETQYGYGNVISFDEFEMSARFLLHEYPLCDAIDFDENARATEDMDVLIVGFGRIGHEVLRKIIAGGQFEGSKFHATIYDPNFEHRTGFFKSQYPNMFANYDIDFEPHNGRGTKIYTYLKQRAAKLKYIVVCLRDRETARDIAVHIVDRLHALGYSQNVYTCDSKSIRCYSQYAKECETRWVYDSELLYSGKIDEYAMELNHRYCGGKNALEDWKQCAYFDRMSSRASVDYLVPLLRKITAKTDKLTAVQRENLAKSEHLRWCAFHYTFGFDVMEKKEFIARVNSYQDEMREFGKSKIKVSKDKKQLKHACLVDWDELDEISRIENSITHKHKDYKNADRENVDMVMELIKSEQTEV